MLLNAEELDKIPHKERIPLIDAEIHRLQCERRLAMLTPKQLDHMALSGLSDENRKTLTAMGSFDDREKYLMMLARAEYFRQLEWASYINGCSPNPPIEGGET